MPAEASQPLTSAKLPEIGKEPASFNFPLGLALPFAHGVASGDPLADRVIIWTRVTLLDEAAAANGVLVNWVVSKNRDLSSPVKTGQQIALPSRDFTVKVDVTDLAPATTYYYGFAALGYSSITGRTRTAPSAGVMAENLRLVVLSCSSYWSSYWSGYGHIANRSDIDLVIHCGDYIYDFVDQDETVRARKGIKSTKDVDYRDWTNLQELRRRYALWRSEANLIAAHQQHPWFITWDNHDLDPDYGNELPSPDLKSTCTLKDTTQAFWEWTPSRPVKADGSGEFLLVNDGTYPVPQDTRLVYRTLPFGKLASIRALDTQIFLSRYQAQRESTSLFVNALKPDASHLPANTPTLFGRTQYSWLLNQLKTDQEAGVVWKVLNNQTWIAPFGVPELTNNPMIPTTAQGPLGGVSSRWGGYKTERDQLFRALRGELAGNSAAAPNGITRIRGTVFVSGDMHGNWGSDLITSGEASVLGAPGTAGQYPQSIPVPATKGGTSNNNAVAGVQQLITGNLPMLNLRSQSAGVEFAPSSMGRGGADELVANAAPGSPFAVQVAASHALEAAVIGGNRNGRFMEWVEHGYGIVDLTPVRALFEFWWQDKLAPNTPDVLGMQMISFATDEPSALPQPHFRDQIDPVMSHGLQISPSSGVERELAPAIAAGALMER